MDPEVQGIVGMVRLCQASNSLPLAGGLMDQDAYFVYLFQLVVIFDNKRVKLEQARQKAR